MKVFVIAAVLTFVATAVAQAGIKLSAEQLQKVRGIVNECIKGTGATETTVHHLRDGNFSNVSDKCFSKCFQERFGLVKDGKVNEAAINKVLGPLAGEDKVKAVQVKCNGVTGSDDCDTALARYKCYFAESIKVLA